MFFNIILIVCIFTLLLLLAWKRKLIKDLFKNRKDPEVAKTLGLSIFATIFVTIFTIYSVPQLLKNVVPFNTYEDYLFWNENSEVTGYAEIEEGVIYSVSHNAKMSLLINDKGYVQSYNAKQIFGDKILSNDNVSISISVWEIEGIDKYVVSAHRMSEEDFELTVDGQKTVLFEKRFNWIRKIKMIEKAESIKVVLNGQEFDLAV